MLLRGFNHVAVLTGDTARFLEFYEGVFEATHDVLEAQEGFRLTRERPGTIFGWGVVYAVCVFLIGQLMLVSLDPQVRALAGKHDLSAADIEQVSDLLAHSWPAFLLVLALVTALLSTLMAGIYRLVLRPGERGFLHLLHPYHRFGLAPLGFVTADARSGCLVINTFHTFPADRTLLKTQTLIERV